MNLTKLLVTQRNVNEISAKFGLSEEQTLEAMAAVIPAFSEGLKRQTQTAQGAAGLIQALSSGRHQVYVQNPLAAVSAEGIADGNAILGHLFGNQEVSRAVANQASAMTGIGSSIFKSLLPVLASMVMGSLFKGATGGSRRGGGGGLGGALGGAVGGGLLGKIIEGLAGGMLGGGAQPQRRAPAPRRRQGGQMPGSLEDLLGQVLGGGRKQQQQTPMPRSRAPSQRTQRRQNQGGLGGLLEEMLGGGQRQRQDPRAQMPRQRRPQQQRRAPQQRRGGGLGEIFGDMLEPGGNTSNEYRKQTGSVFDEFLGN
ncbi:MAG: DUF937 domain-containing protein [Rhizobiaceae bacterium]